MMVDLSATRRACPLSSTLVEVVRALVLLVPCCAACVGLPPPPPLDQGESTSLSSTPDGFDTKGGDGTGTTVVVDGISSTSSAGTTEPECTGTGEDDCSPAEPFCEPTTLMCVACDAMPMPDMACAGSNPERPLCVKGQCVQCTAEDTTICTKQGLLCVQESGECVPCTEHAQCESGACELAEGTCFSMDVVVHVDGDGGQDYTSVAAAVDDVAAGEAAVIVVHEFDGGVSYGPVLIDEGRIIALMATAGEIPMIQGFGSNSGVRVEGDGTKLYMNGLHILGSGGAGLAVTGAVAWVDRSRIVQNSGGGVVAEDGAVLVVLNSFVGANGAGGHGSYGVDVNGATAHVLYTTIARNDELMTDSIRCMDGTVDVRNSIVVGRDASSIDCLGILITNSALDEDIGGNVNVGAAVLAWFESATTGDFHLTPMGAMVFADIAVWQSGDPLIDIDGDRRPSTDGVFDYAGADVP